VAPHKYQGREELLAENSQLRITVNELMNRIIHVNTHAQAAGEKLGLLYSRTTRKHLKAIVLMSTIVQKMPAQPSPAKGPSA
jgi:hypothetical protein